MALRVPGLAFIILQLSVESNVVAIEICTITNISVEYFDRDVKSKLITTKKVRSSERFQKAVSEFSLAIGVEIGIKGMGFSMNSEFSQMNSKELSKSNYASDEQTDKIEFSEHSRQLIRETTKRVTLRKTVGNDEAKADAYVVDEKHVGSIDKKCPSRDDTRLYKQANEYMKHTYKNQPGTIRGHEYGEANCYTSSIQFYIKH